MPSELSLWSVFLLYSPLGVIGAWRWGMWLWQKVIGLGYRPLKTGQPLNRQYSLSIITPVYNEDTEVFRRALDSWQRNEPDEMIAVIDASDTDNVAVFREVAPSFRKALLIITEIPGKRPALAEGIRAATSEIVALSDSDTLWDADIAPLLLAPFDNPSIGGVAPRQAVLAPRTLSEQLFSIRLDLRYLQEYPYLMVVGDALTCLSGRTAVYRRDALLPLLDDLVFETFLGSRCISGEDKRLTSLVLSNGWRVRYEKNACVRTFGTPDLRTYFSQNLRWGRNSWRTDLRLMTQGWVWRREPFFAYHLIDRAIQPFTLLLGPTFFGLSLALGQYSAALILFLWWMVSRTIKLLPHLRQYPKHLLVVPAYIVTTYLLALIKIYALFTLNYQSWITRWHRKRIREWSFAKLLPARIGMFTLLFTATFFIAQHEFSEAAALQAKRALNAIPFTEDFSRFALDDQEKKFWEERARHRTGQLRTQSGDTLLTLSQRYHIPLAELARLAPGFGTYTLLPQNMLLEVPVEILQRPIDQSLPARTNAKLSVLYDEPTNTILVRGRDNTITLPLIASWLGREDLLLRTDTGDWLLKSNLYIGNGVTLVLDNRSVAWLKLESVPGKFINLTSYNGSIIIRDTKITSWDSELDAPDSEYQDGRAYIRAYNNGRMDVIRSEIAYLGYPRSTEQRLTDSQGTGGIYGLSWKIPNGSFHRSLLSGSVVESRVHHNYFGMYMFGATGMTIRDNEVFDNVQYGIDPHDDSNNFLIERNLVYDNGNHGIIGSKRVNFNTIRENVTRGNHLHGIMLDRQSNYNLVENNISTDNVNGLAVYDSHQNLVKSNLFANNIYGIRANMSSGGNRFAENTITGHRKGIYLYGGAEKNIIIDNRIASNEEGINLKQASGNIVVNSLREDENDRAIKLDEYAHAANYIGRFR